MNKNFLGIDKRYSNLEETLTAIYDDVKHPRSGLCTNILSPSSHPNMKRLSSPIFSPSVLQCSTYYSVLTELQKSTQLNQEDACSLNLAEKNDAFLKAVVVAADCSTYMVKVFFRLNAFF